MDVRVVYEFRSKMDSYLHRNTRLSNCYDWVQICDALLRTWEGWTWPADNSLSRSEHTSHIARHKQELPQGLQSKLSPSADTESERLASSFQMIAWCTFRIHSKDIQGWSKNHKQKEKRSQVISLQREVKILSSLMFDRAVIKGDITKYILSGVTTAVTLWEGLPLKFQLCGQGHQNLTDLN